jgi:hypothetical protein
LIISTFVPLAFSVLELHLLRPLHLEYRQNS